MTAEKCCENPLIEQRVRSKHWHAYPRWLCANCGKVYIRRPVWLKKEVKI